MRDTRTAGYRNRNGSSSYRVRRPSNSGWLTGLGKALIFLMALPAKLIIFLTKPPGSAIVLSFCVVYFFGVSVENYWQTFSSYPAFMPKPGIPDNANFGVLFQAIRTTSFWGAVLVSALVQGVQAFALREISVEAAKARYEAVANYEVPEENPKSLDIAEERRKQYAGVGMRTLRMKGLLIVGSYLVDIVTSFWNYPLLAVSVSRLFIHLVWNILSVIGTEAAVNLFLESMDSLHTHPKVEVMPE